MAADYTRKNPPASRQNTPPPKRTLGSQGEGKVSYAGDKGYKELDPKRSKGGADSKRR